MATLLETFFTRLGFEVDDAGLKNAQSKIAGLGKSILGLGIFSGLSIAGIAKLTLGTAEALGNVERLSQRSGIATTTIAGMSKAAAAFGVTNEGVQGSLESVNRALGGIVTGTAPRMKAVFKAIGLTATDSAGQQKDVVTFLGDVADRIRGLSTGAQQQILSRLGIDQNMVTMLRNGREEFIQLYDTAAKGVLFKPEDYKRAEEFQRTFTRVKGITTAIGQGIGLEIMRPMANLLDRFNKWWASNGKKIMEEMRGRLKGWMDAFTLLGNIFTKFGDKGHLIVRVMELLTVAVGALIALKVVGWIGDIIGAFKGWGGILLAVGALIYLIIDDFLAWKSGGKSVIGYFEKNYPEAFKMLRDGFRNVREALIMLRDAAKEFWKEAGPSIKEFAKEIGKLAVEVGFTLLVASIKLAGEAIKELSALIKGLTPYASDYIKKSVEEFKALRAWVKKTEAAWNELDGTSEGLSGRMKATWREWGEEIKKDWADAGNFIRNDFKQWGAEIKNDWNTVKESFKTANQETKDDFSKAGEDIKAIWTATKEFFSSGFTGIKEMWADVTTRFTEKWDAMTASLRSIWQNFMGWLEPWLKRIETAFNFIKGGAADLAKSASESMSKATGSVVSSIGDKLRGFVGQRGATSPMMELAGAPAIAAPVSNANTQTTQNNDIKATINLTAPSPERAAELTADKINDLARLNTLYGQSISY